MVSIEHNIDSKYGQVMAVDHAPEAADLCIINHTKTYDIVVTQDLVLVKGTRVLTHSEEILE